MTNKNKLFSFIVNIDADDDVIFSSNYFSKKNLSYYSFKVSGNTKKEVLSLTKSILNSIKTDEIINKSGYKLLEEAIKNVKKNLNKVFDLGKISSGGNQSVSITTEIYDQEFKV